MKPWCLTIYFVVAESLSSTRFGVFFSVLSIILRNNSPYDLMKKKNIKDTMEALLSYSGQLMRCLIFYFGGFLLSCDISEELKKFQS